MTTADKGNPNPHFPGHVFTCLKALLKKLLMISPSSHFKNSCKNKETLKGGIILSPILKLLDFSSSQTD